MSLHCFCWCFYPFDVTVDCNAGTGGPIKRIPCTNLHLLMQRNNYNSSSNVYIRDAFFCYNLWSIIRVGYYYIML